jgi:hypothetical protein
LGGAMEIYHCKRSYWITYQRSRPYLFSIFSALEHQLKFWIIGKDTTLREIRMEHQYFKAGMKKAGLILLKVILRLYQ